MPLNRRAPNLELELEQVVERVGRGPALPACLPAGPQEREGRFVSFLCARSSAHAQEPTLCLIRRSLSPTSDVFSQHGAGVKRNCVPQRGRKPGEASGPLTQETPHSSPLSPPSKPPPTSPPVQALSTGWDGRWTGGCPDIRTQAPAPLHAPIPTKGRRAKHGVLAG